MAELHERPKEQWDVLTMLRSAPATLTGLVSGLGEDLARRQVGEEWSIAAIVAHLVDGEWAWFTRIRRMATEEQPLMEMFPNADYSGRSLGESLTGYVRNRAQDLDYLESLAPARWARRGRHELWGDIDVLWAARHLAAHDAEHFAQIARLREQAKSA
jgi:DinB superfamily